MSDNKKGTANKSDTKEEKSQSNTPNDDLHRQHCENQAKRFAHHSTQSWSLK